MFEAIDKAGVEIINEPLIREKTENTVMPSLLSICNAIISTSTESALSEDYDKSTCAHKDDDNAYFNNGTNMSIAVKLRYSVQFKSKH